MYTPNLHKMLKYIDTYIEKEREFHICVPPPFLPDTHTYAFMHTHTHTHTHNLLTPRKCLHSLYLKVCQTFQSTNHLTDVSNHVADHQFINQPAKNVTHASAFNFKQASKHPQSVNTCRTSSTSSRSHGVDAVHARCKGTPAIVCFTLVDILTGESIACVACRVENNHNNAMM